MVIEKVYPLHSIVEFAQEVDPNTAIGCGTVWERWTEAEGRVLIGANAPDAEDQTYAVGSEGGEAEVKLTSNGQNAPHVHTVYSVRTNSIEKNDTGAYSLVVHPSNPYLGTSVGMMQSSGGTAAHNNMQPYIAVSRWVRVA